SELNSQLLVARAQVTEARARLDRIESIIQSGLTASSGLPSTQAGVPDATVTDTLNNQVVTKLRMQYLELANREAEWANRYGSDHIAVLKLQGQMKELRNSISDELRRIAETYKSDYEISKQREESIQRALTNVISQSQVTNQAQVKAGELE